MTLKVNTPIKGDKNGFKVNFIQDNLPCYTNIPLKSISKHLGDMNVEQAIELFLVFHSDEIEIVSLN
jgi:hypothetical protein